MKTNIYLLLFTFLVPITSIAQTYDEQYEICSKEIKKLDTVDSLYFELIKQRDICLIGTPAPTFTATTIDNEILDLSKLKGKVVMLNFWFTRCQPCIKEMPDLNKLVDLYSNKNVEFISFAPEDSNNIKDFLKKHDFKFKIVADSETIRRDKFKLFSIWPYSILIDKEGRINKIVLVIPQDNIATYYQGLIDNLLN